MEQKDIFAIRQTNEEANDFIITVGKHLASEKHFKTKEEAEEYIKKPEWDTTLSLVAEMLEIKDQREKTIQMTNNFQEMEDKK